MSDFTHMEVPLMPGDSDLQATEISPLSVEQILAQLDDAALAPPIDALCAARQRRDEIVPRLIEILQEATAKARAGEIREGSAHWAGVYLLAEFRATQALPAVLEAVSLPGELPFELFGDLITEDLSRILVSLDIDVETLSSMIDNRQLNQYVRWKAADTITALVLDGQLRREDGVERLRRHLRTALDRDDVETIGHLIIELCSIWPIEAKSEIREAFDRDLVDPYDIQWREVERDLADGEEGMRAHAQHRGPARILDAVEEFESWHWPTERESIADEPLLPRWRPEDNEGTADDEDLAGAMPPEPVRAAAERVGRNQTCPCGSGKKYKKCCGRLAPR